MPTPDQSAGGARERRDTLVDIVATFDPRTEREAISRQRFVRELGRLPEPFSRTADPVHVTASAIVIGARGTALHLHKRVGRWLQPGGHIERGEAPEDAALREALEELGLPLRHPDGGPRLIHLDAHPAGDHFHLDLRYVLLGEDVAPSPGEGESQQARWFSIPEAMALADESLAGALWRLPDIGRGVPPSGYSPLARTSRTWSAGTRSMTSLPRQNS